MRWRASLVALALAIAAAVPAAGTQLQIDVPTRLEAGDPLEITVLAPGHDTASVLVIGGLRSHAASLDLIEGVGELTVVDATLLRAGLVTVVARSGGIEVVRHVDVLAGAAAHPLRPAVSPARVPADGVAGIVVLAVPEDAYGNVVADGTDVSATWIGPDGTTDAASAPTADLVWHAAIQPGQLAGVTEIVLRVSDITAIGAFDVLPGPPASVALTAVRPAGGDVVVVESERLVDAAGNELLDGVAVTFSIDDAEGRQIVQSQVIGGRARLRLPAPAEGEAITVSVVVAGVASQTVTYVEERP